MALCFFRRTLPVVIFEASAVRDCSALGWWRAINAMSDMPILSLANALGAESVNSSVRRLARSKSVGGWTNSAQREMKWR